MPYQTSTHVSLLARLVSGESSVAWNEFHDRYQELIWSFARSRGLQPADADDVVQDVLHAVSRSVKSFEYDPAKGRFRDYLKTAAARAVWRKIRELKGAPRLPTDDEPFDVSFIDASLDEAWETEWRHYHLRLAMNRIRNEFNANDVAAFEMYGAEGREAASVAATLRMTLDQVYQAKSRIMRRLKAIIAEQTAEEG